MLIDKKRRLIAVPAKRRIKNYSSTHGGGGTAVILYGNFDVSKYNFVKSEKTNCNFCGKTAVYA